MLTDDERRAELHVETELVDGALYGGYGYVVTWLDGEWEFDANLPSDWQPAFRYAPVARYEPPKFEFAELPKLGLATTRELLKELTARIETDYAVGGGGLDYSTVKGRPSLSEGVEL